jgi:hypothetical protein
MRRSVLVSQSAELRAASKALRSEAADRAQHRAMLAEATKVERRIAREHRVALQMMECQP